MKIALLGYGKMGKAIETIAVERGHSIGATIDNAEDWTNKLQALRECDMAIDFSMPATAVDNIMRCFDLQLPVVVGTTGWYDHLQEVVETCQKGNQALFVASNFSIGMNMMFALNQQLARLMNGHPEYQLSITETHHIHKLDAPSGTAISLANDICASIDRYEGWKLEGCTTENSQLSTLNSQLSTQIPITSIREGEVPGIHEVVYDSEVDTITISHSAKSRKGLALGAVLAAEFLQGRKGYYTMKELLHLIRILC